MTEYFTTAFASYRQRGKKNNLSRDCNQLQRRRRRSGAGRAPSIRDKKLNEFNSRNEFVSRRRNCMVLAAMVPLGRLDVISE